MSKNTDAREFWHSELGDDSGKALWNAFTEVEPPELDRQTSGRPQAPWLWMGMAASWLAIAALFAWNFDLQKDVVEAQEQTALVLLEAERSDRVLAGLANVRQLKRDPEISAALLELLKNSDDPNVQIDALDLLLDNVLKDPDLRREVLEQVRFNRSFVEFAIQSQEVRT
jgi:hypothetical protein